MKKVKLFEALNLVINKKNIIAVVGGGGKTTTIKTLAMELKGLGLKVLNATSTCIFVPKENEYDALFIGDLPMEFIPSKGTITYIGQVSDGIKLKLKDIDFIDEIINRNIFDLVLMEADGSKGLPIKAPNNQEPVISKFTNISIGIIGLDSLGTRIDDQHVHRPEIFREIVNKDIIDLNGVVDLVKHEKGLFKNSRGRKILILNKANNQERIKRAREIKRALSSEDIRILIADIQSGRYDII